MEPLKGRAAAGLRLATMQAVARLKAHGIPVLRWHSDRAKEYTSHKLLAWLASQGIMVTMSAPRNHAANGRAEVAVREIKRRARKMPVFSRFGFSPVAISREAGI